VTSTNVLCPLASELLGHATGPETVLKSIPLSPVVVVSEERERSLERSQTAAHGCSASCGVQAIQNVGSGDALDLGI